MCVYCTMMRFQIRPLHMPQHSLQIPGILPYSTGESGRRSTLQGSRL